MYNDKSDFTTVATPVMGDLSTSSRFTQDGKPHFRRDFEQLADGRAFAMESITQNYNALQD